MAAARVFSVEVRVAGVPHVPILPLCVVAWTRPAAKWLSGIATRIVRHVMDEYDKLLCETSWRST